MLGVARSLSMLDVGSENSGRWEEFLEFSCDLYKSGVGRSRGRVAVSSNRAIKPEDIVQFNSPSVCEQVLGTALAEALESPISRWPNHIRIYVAHADGSFTDDESPIVFALYETFVFDSD